MENTKLQNIEYLKSGRLRQTQLRSSISVEEKNLRNSKKLKFEQNKFIIKNYAFTHEAGLFSRLFPVLLN